MALAKRVDVNTIDFTNPSGDIFRLKKDDMIKYYYEENNDRKDEIVKIVGFSVKDDPYVSNIYISIDGKQSSIRVLDNLTIIPASSQIPFEGAGAPAAGGRRRKRRQTKKKTRRNRRRSQRKH